MERATAPLIKKHPKTNKKMRQANFNNRIELEADNDIYEGQSVERYVEQAETTKQPIEGGAPEIFTPRKDGVRPEYNIRTDRWELAQNAMDKVAASYTAKRADMIKAQENKNSANGSDQTSDSAEPAA